jgi:UDP-N-acetylmuramoyl-tripeptide--D-alanyl-D-alanine ligase
MAAAMRAAVQGLLPEAITGLSIDSRTVAPGEAYFAIKGDVHDGHAFVEAALKAGAALAVVETAQAASFAGAPLLVVDDVLSGRCEVCDRRGRDESRRRNPGAGQDGAAACRHHHHRRAGAS